VRRGVSHGSGNLDGTWTAPTFCMPGVSRYEDLIAWQRSMELADSSSIVW